jgi:hypothetical protein
VFSEADQRLGVVDHPELSDEGQYRRVAVVEAVEKRRDGNWYRVRFSA